MHRLLIISRPRILFENNAPFPLYRSYVFPSPQTCSFRFIFLVPGCFPFLRLFIFLLAPSPCFLSSLAARFPSFHSPPPPSPSHSFPHQSRPRTSFVIFLNFFLLLFLFHPSFPYELNVHSLLPPPCFLPLSPLSLSSPAPLLVYCPPRSTLLGEGGEREEKEGGKNVVHSSTSSKFRESTCFASGTSLSACT